MTGFSRIVIALLAVGVAAESAAQGMGQGQGQGQGQGRGRGQNRPAIRFAEMDANRDRVITRAEWRGSTRSFEVHDWNGDGILSGDEVRVGAQRPRIDDEDEDDLDSVWDTPEMDDWTVEHFRVIDRNRDGRITAGEWYFDRELFRRVDHNGDNSLSEAEFLGSQDVDDDREDLFEYLDDNKDGRVSRSEWHGTRARFDALDRDRNNVLTRAEAMGTDAPADLFDAIDLNSDRAIARTEWRWSTASFDLRDTNRDGRLTRDEFAGITANRPTAYRAGYDRGLIDGRAAGREDRARNQGWDLEGQRELEQADAGYQAAAGPRAEYQAGYREGFRRGYREGWEAKGN